MLQPAAPPESSLFEVVTSISVSASAVLVVTSITRKYVVLAARAIPLPDAVKLLVAFAVSEPEIVSVPRLLPGLPPEADRMLTLKDGDGPTELKGMSTLVSV